MSYYPDLYVLRHGQTKWNRIGKFQGSRDSPLTKTGIAHAASQKEILRELGLPAGDIRCFVSPQGRARQTAEIALADFAEPATEDSRLREIEFGDWEARFRVEIIAQLPDDLHPSRSNTWPFHAPNGESFANLSGRARDFLDHLTGPTVVITHGITSIVLRGLWLGLSKSEMLALPHAQGCVYHLSNQAEQCLIGDPR